jgi:hypothetical protein
MFLSKQWKRLYENYYLLVGGGCSLHVKTLSLRHVNKLIKKKMGHVSARRLSIHKIYKMFSTKIAD